MDSTGLAIGVAVEGTALEGGTRSFETFYDLHRPRVLALCYALADGVAAAEDIAQEAFVRTYLQWGKVSGMEHPGAWVRRVAVNLATSRRRRLAAEARALVRFGTAARRADDEPSSDADFWKAVRRLPPRQAQAVALHYADDLAVSDVALVMGCAEGTVKAHLHAARSGLVHLLERGDGQ